MTTIERDSPVGRPCPECGEVLTATYGAHKAIGRSDPIIRSDSTARCVGCGWSGSQDIVRCASCGSDHVFPAPSDPSAGLPDYPSDHVVDEYLDSWRCAGCSSTELV